MRIHEGDFAYDLEQPPDPLTQLRTKWKFTVYKIRPAEQKLASGEADTREAAEKKARTELARVARASGPRAA
ncbi:MAG TPA: hypothetical protein VFY05_12555 [Candidatus Angelobacter sp.]|nr:hypothetical protein [Candidatus Angelobacter sp.]